MTIDPDEAVERDDLAPTKRLHIIRQMNDGERVVSLIGRTGGKRLRYRGVA